MIFINGTMFFFSAVMAKSAFDLSLSLVDEYLALTHLSKAFTYGSMFIGFVGVCIMLAFNLLKYVMIEIVRIDKEGAAK